MNIENKPLPTLDSVCDYYARMGTQTHRERRRPQRKGGGVMTLYHVTVKWVLGRVEQTNVIPIWASSEVTAVNMVRGKLFWAMACFSEPSAISRMEVKVAS